VCTKESPLDWLCDSPSFKHRCVIPLLATYDWNLLVDILFARAREEYHVHVHELSRCVRHPTFQFEAQFLRPECLVASKRQDRSLVVHYVVHFDPVIGEGNDMAY